MEKTFYRVNNFLIITVILFLGIVVVLKANPAHSAQDVFNQYFNGSLSQPTSSSSPYIIGKTVDVEFKPPTYDVSFVSNGNTDGISEEQKDKFFNGKLAPIPVPLKFDVSKSYVELPGELVYPAIPKGTAPSSTVCNEKVDVNNLKEDCLYNVTSMSVFTDLAKRQLLLSTDPNVKVAASNGGTIFDALFQALNIVSSVNEFVAAVSGAPDQQRGAIGTVEWWADDELQQLAPINGKGVDKAIAQSRSAAVNVSEGLFASDLSGKINSTMERKNIRINIYQGLQQDVGFSNFSDPITSIVDNPGSGAALESVTDAIGTFITQITTNNFKAEQKQNKISAQVALRTINESDIFSVSYSFCDGLEANGLLSGYSNYTNPYIKFKDPVVTKEAVKLGDVIVVPEVTEYAQPEHNWYLNYEKLNSKIKKCISAITAYTDEGKVGEDTKAFSCAQDSAKSPDVGCDEFSVEDTDLSFSMIQKSLPIGFGATFQNGTLNDLNPDIEGPYYNYLSPYFCAKLNIVYNITTKAKYIYSFGGKNQSKDDKQLASKEVNNQYCVLSSLLSNFSWTLFQQERYFGTNNFGTINLPKEALTCDKKEIAIIGGTFVKANIQSPKDQLVYINEDNIRGAVNDSIKNSNEDVLLNHGPNPISLREVISDADVQDSIFKYRDNDMKVLVDSSTQKPKYVLFSMKKAEKNMQLAVCKLDVTTVNGVKDKMCKVLRSADWILSGDVTMVANGKTDLITIVDYEGENDDGGTVDPAQVRKNSGNSTDASGPRPVRYSVVEVDPTDMTKTTMTAGAQNLAEGIYSRFDTLQLDRGTTAVLISQFEKGILKKMYALDINPITKTVTNLTGDICTQFTDCKILTDKDHQEWANGKIVEDHNTHNLYIVIVGGGLGVVYPINLKQANQQVDHYLFSFKKNSTSYKDKLDFISTAQFVDGDLHLFMQNSGYYLRILFPWTNFGIQKQGQIEGAVREKCKLADNTRATNCLIAIQYEFNPDIFTSDCSDYDGVGACGYPVLTELGHPIVMEFKVSPTGAIHAWYKYSKLSNTLLESIDLLYSYSGVYSQVSGDEYSNAYVPNPVKQFTASPMRYFNYGSGGWVLGKQLEKNGSYVTENIQVMKPDKYKCFQNMAKITGIDLYASQTGLQATNVNNSSIINAKPSPSTGGSTQNSGDYCEESWCVPDNVDFIGGAEFKGDNNVTLKNKIVDFFVKNKTRYGGAINDNLEALYYQKVDIMCSKAAAASISCAFLAGIWQQESSGSLDEGPKSPPFGCFGESIFGASWATFNTQVDCAIGSLKSSSEKYAAGETLIGPGSKFTPNVGVTPVPTGTCKPATLFSMAMQRYTPIDSRINFNNQCNKGLLIRDDQEQCISYGLVAGAESGNTKYDASTTSGKWPSEKMSKSRIRLQKALQAIDPRLKADNDFCFPAGSTSSGGDSVTTGDADVQAVLSKYDTDTYTDTANAVNNGKFSMRWGQWTTGWAAGNVAMALDGSVSGRTVDGVTKYGIKGAHIVAPGKSFSFNDAIGNPSGSEVEAKYPEYIKKGYTFDGTRVVGGGWCELATTLRMAATRVKAKQPPTSLSTTRSGCNYGTGQGYTGDVASCQHSDGIKGSSGGAPLSWFNNLLALPSDPLTAADQYSYVSIWSLGGGSTDSDGDLVIRNPYPEGSGIDMIIAVSVDSEKTITSQLFFGKLKPVTTDSGNR